MISGHCLSPPLSPIRRRFVHSLHERCRRVPSPRQEFTSPRAFPEHGGRYSGTAHACLQVKPAGGLQSPESGLWPQAGKGRLRPLTSAAPMSLMRWRLLIELWRTVGFPTADFDGAPSNDNLGTTANSSAKRLPSSCVTSGLPNGSDQGLLRRTQPRTQGMLQMNRVASGAGQVGRHVEVRCIVSARKASPGEIRQYQE